MSNNNPSTEEKVVDNKSANKVVEVKAKNVAKAKKKNKVKKPNKVAESLKNTGKELKRISWPKLIDVIKQTGIVLVFVIVFAVVIFGFDRLCGWLTQFLITY